MKLIADPAQGSGKLKACEAWERTSFEAEEALQETLRMADAAAAAANMTVKQSEELCKRVQTARMFAPPVLVTTVGTSAPAETHVTPFATFATTASEMTAMTVARNNTPLSTASKTMRGETELDKAMEVYKKSGGNNIEMMTHKLANSKPWEVRQWCEKWRKEIAKKEASDMWMEKAKFVHDWAHEKKRESHASWDDLLKRYIGWTKTWRPVDVSLDMWLGGARLRAGA